MFELVLWFVGIIVSVLLMHLLVNYIRSMLPGQNKTYMLQPIYRLVKLACKKNEGSYPLTQWYSAGACWFALAALWLTVSGQNIIMVISVLVMMELFVLIGSSNSNNLFGFIAVQRKISGFLVLCFICLVAAASVYKVTGTLSLAEISAYADNNSLILRLPLTFISLVIVLMIEESICWFDTGVSGEGTSFIDTGLYSSYEGWCLAVIQLTQWVNVGVWLKLISVFLPWSPLISFVIAALLHFVLRILDSFIAKVRWKKAVLNAFIWAGVASVINYAWLYLTTA